MNTPTANSRVYEFCFPKLDTLVEVEEADGTVVIRASRNTFSEERKTRFLRELAAEGFIPDDYQWLAPAGPETSQGVRWLVDISCFKPDKALVAGTRRIMVRLLSSAALLWLLMMCLLFLRHAR